MGRNIGQQADDDLPVRKNKTQAVFNIWKCLGRNSYAWQHFSPGNDAVAGLSAAGAIFQVCLALTCQSFPNISGTASSVVALSASAGGTFCCWLVGFVAEQLGFFAALSIQAVVLLLIVPITIFGIRNPTNT